MRMGPADYSAGSGHEKESRSATDGRCGSWVHARTAKDNHKTRLGDEGQGMLVESRTLTGGECYEGKSPSKNQAQIVVRKKEKRTAKREQTTSADIPAKHNITTQ